MNVTGDAEGSAVCMFYEQIRLGLGEGRAREGAFPSSFSPAHGTGQSLMEPLGAEACRLGGFVLTPAGGRSPAMLTLSVPAPTRRCRTGG